MGIENLLERAAVYVKGKYLRVRVKIVRDREEALEIAQALREKGFNPVIERVGSRYYYVMLARMEDVVRVVDQYIGLERLSRRAREVYESRYRDLSLKGLKYKLTLVIEDPCKRAALFYILGALVGDGNEVSTYRVKLAVKDREFADKFEKKVREIGLHAYRPRGGRPDSRGVYEVLVNSVHLCRLFRQILETPAMLLSVDPRSFWAFIEGLYEADGSLRLIRGKRTEKEYFEIRIRQVSHKELLYVLAERLRSLGINARVGKYRGEYARVLRIKGKESVYRFFQSINPVIKNPKTGKLSYKQYKSCLLRGIDPAVISKKWKERWEEYASEFNI